MGPPPPATPSSYNALVASFSSLLTITIHTLLYARSLYPPSTFLTARAYNIPVHQSRHPTVCGWINNAVAAITIQLLKCTVARVALVVFESEGQGRVLERWVWDVSGWPVVPKEEGETVLVREGAAPGKWEVDMEEQFRGLLAKLAHVQLAALPANCTFTLCIEQRDQVPAPIGHPQPWIPSQPELQSTVVEQGNEAYGGNVKRQVRKGAELGGARTVPVRKVEAGEMRFEMWVEEGQAKFERSEKSSQGATSTGSE